MRKITLYTFDELPWTVQNKIVDSALESDVYRDIHYDHAMEWGKDQLYRKLGLVYPADIEVAIDASFSQGSGMSFTGTIYRDQVHDPDVRSQLFPYGATELVVEREQWGHYVHDNLILVTLFDDEGHPVPDENDEVRGYLRGVLQGVHSDVEDVILSEDRELAENIVFNAEREYDSEGRILL